MASQLTEEQKQIVLKADELVEAIKAREEQKDYWENIYQAKLEQITARRDEIQGKLDDEIGTYKQELRTLVDLLPTKETKTQIKAELLGGDVVVKKPTQKIVQPATDDLLTMIFDAGREDLVKTVQKPMWADFKKLLTIVDNKVVNTETGETLNIAIEDVPEQLVIK